MRALTLCSALVCVALCGACDATRSTDQQAQPPTAACGDGSASKRATPLRVVLVTDLEGVLEPCGCSSAPAGGMDRVFAEVEQLRHGATATLVLAAGNLLLDPDRVSTNARRMQDEWSAQTLDAILGRLAPDVLAPGPVDLEHASARLRALTQRTPTPSLLAADDGSLGAAFAASVLRDVGGFSVGIATGSTPALLRAEVERLRARGAQLVIVAVHGAAMLAREVAAESGADLVVHSGGGADLAASTEQVGAALLAHAGHHGEGVLSIDLWPAREHNAVTRYIALDASTPRDATTRATLDALFARINAHNSSLTSTADTASPTQQPQRRAHADEYVGSETCAACHTQAYFWWRSTPHGRAFETLVARGRELDLDCVGCHVTGMAERADNLTGIEHRKGVGCESCHGPGSAHVDNPRQPLRVMQRQVPQALCVSCHDREHSRPFDYAARVRELLVPAHGAQGASP